jgi:hypothetical protein
MALVWVKHHYGFSSGFLLYVQKQWLTICKAAPPGAASSVVGTCLFYPLVCRGSARCPQRFAPTRVAPSVSGKSYCCGADCGCATVRADGCTIGSAAISLASLAAILAWAAALKWMWSH